MSLTPQQIAEKFAQVQRIVSATTTAPTIVNEASQFVVVTYWWGRSRENFNTARPCGEFYETLLSKPIRHLSVEEATPEAFRNALLENPDFVRFVKRKVNDYTGLIRAHKNHGLAFSQIYTEKTAEQIYELIFQIVLAYIETILPDVRHFQQLFDERTALEKTFRRRLNAGMTSKEQLDTIRARLLELSLEKAEVQRRMKSTVGPFKNAMDRALRYMDPITYDQMIANWEASCARVGCNYLAVEYPQFAEPGGYQLAINAKPHFIQKALELCRGRGVLYIDGDMTVNQYPAIFDTPDVDMMARGWNVDPRSSSHYEDSILVDPYTFETSGGTMFFGQTPEAHLLLQRWIEVSEQPSQWGKADDRILSLVFNTNKLLLPLKIIQLPIEYLWLTMAYDDYMDLEDVVLEHPECLTTEETASGQGASSDRTPKYYGVIEDLYPRSEFLHEAVLFPTAESTAVFRPYLNYLKKARYLADVEDESLVDAPPFKVVSFQDGLGPFQGVANANAAIIASLPPLQNTKRITITNHESNIVPRILQALQGGADVFYIPDTASDVYKQSLTTTLKQFPRIEFAFVNKSTDSRRIFFFNSVFAVGEPAFFRAACPRLQQLLSMCRTLDDLSVIFRNGYQFLSLIRTHFLKRYRDGTTGGAVGNVGNSENAYEFLYGNNHVGGFRNRKTRRRKLQHSHRKTRMHKKSRVRR